MSVALAVLATCPGDVGAASSGSTEVSSSLGADSDRLVALDQKETGELSGDCGTARNTRPRDCLFVKGTLGTRLCFSGKLRDTTCSVGKGP